MKFQLVIVVCMVFFCAEASAQMKLNTIITGRVIDNSTQEPLDFVTIALKEESTGKVLNGTLSKTNGEFRLTGIPAGSYVIEVDHISYQKVTVDSLYINDNNQSLFLGTIELNPDMMNLEAVNIVSDRPVIENEPGKIIYNVTSDITSQGGLAIDVLKKVPQVTVDIDGNVELQGNSNIRFLINGKPSSVFGNSLSDALASIPASQIKSIEAITNPGSKYDSQGTGGIINIILTDEKLKGISGNLNLTGGTRLQNGSANFSFKRNNFGVNAFFGGHWRLRSEGKSLNQRETTDSINDMVTTLLQEGLDYSDRLGFRSGGGFEWDISGKDKISGSVGYNQFGFNFSGLTGQKESLSDLSGNNISEILTVRNFENRRRVSSVDWSLDYSRDFGKEGHMLDFLLSSSHGRPYSGYSQTESFADEVLPYKGSSSSNPGTDNQVEMAIDYVVPFSKKFVLETGVKSVMQNLTSIAEVSVLSPALNEYKDDPLQSYDLKYNLRIYAGYISASLELGNFLDLKPGIRYEYTGVSIDFPETSIPSYGTLVPSVSIAHSLNEKNSLELSYNKRIERPEYRELNPFIDRSDPYNIETGNIFLKPEIGNTIELSYNAGFKKGGSLRLTLREQITSGEIDPVTVFYPEYAIGDSVYRNVSVTTRENIGEEYNSGFSAFISYPVNPRLNLRSNIMVFHRYIGSTPDRKGMSTGINARLNLNATLQLPKDLVLEFFGFYRSAGRGLQGRTPQFFIYNFAMRKRFWDQNGSLGLTATNPFGRSIRRVSTITTENSVSKSIRELPFRSFGISFTYKFGKVEPNNRNREGGNEMIIPESGAN